MSMYTGCDCSYSGANGKTEDAPDECDHGNALTAAASTQRDADRAAHESPVYISPRWWQ